VLFELTLEVRESLLELPATTVQERHDASTLTRASTPSTPGLARLFVTAPHLTGCQFDARPRLEPPAPEDDTQARPSQSARTGRNQRGDPHDEVAAAADVRIDARVR
jgi:hypothetical protein